MKPFSEVRGRPAILAMDNVDTDQIIPASFLKGVDREGLAEGLFHGWRFQDDGSPDPDFVLNRQEHEGAQILVVGENFGCGSSREHAPWALQAWGLRVIIGRSFADIFRGNAHRNGLLTVELDEGRHEALIEQIRAHPEAEVVVRLEPPEVEFPLEGSATFSVDPFSRHCMVNGVDPMGHLLQQIPAIEQYEAALSSGGPSMEVGEEATVASSASAASGPEGGNP